MSLHVSHIRLRPLCMQAGQGLDVYYNPELTPLRGRPDVYVHCSWDRGDAGNRHR